MLYLHHAYLNVTQGVDLLNASADVGRALRESQVVNGLLTVFIPQGGAGVVLLENKPALQAEFKELIVSFADKAHLRGALLSSSVGIPIKDGKLLLGPWQEVIIFDFDEKVGRREVLLHVMGEGAEKAGDKSQETGVKK